MPRVAVTLRQPVMWCTIATLRNFVGDLERLAAEGNREITTTWSAGLRNGQSLSGNNPDDELYEALTDSAAPRRVSVSIGARYSSDETAFTLIANRYSIAELQVTAPSREWLRSNLPYLKQELRALGPWWARALNPLVTGVTTFVGVGGVVFGLIGLMATGLSQEVLVLLAVGLAFSIPLVFPRIRIKDRPIWRGWDALGWLWTLLAGAVAGAFVSSIWPD